MNIEENLLIDVTDADIIGGKFIIPKWITEIGTGAFRDCTTLKSVDLSNVTHVGLYAFDGCTSLPRPSEDIRKEIYNKALQLINTTDEGLCYCIGNAIASLIVKHKQAISIATCFPQFTYINAVKRNVAYGYELGYWWHRGDRRVRKTFLKWCYEDFNEEE